MPKGKPAPIPVPGQRFEKLRFVAIEGRNSRGDTLWKCQCDCGKETIAVGCNVRGGNTKSCGCGKHPASTLCPSYKHGHSRAHSPEYISWCAMIQRCNNPVNPSYPRYGGRGITVCERWANSFESFLAAMGPRPKGHTLERIDNSKGYEPDNCKWATRSEQNNNTSRNIIITFQGQAQTLTKWAAQIGVKSGTLLRRIRAGWSIEKALTAPVRSW